jgi:hypothetical protein
MLTLTLSFNRWLGFDAGIFTQFAGRTATPDANSRITQLYRVNNYYVNFGCISLSFTGGAKAVSEREMNDELRNLED